MAWSDEQINEVVRLRESGLTSTEIAAELLKWTGVKHSRNAILGLIYRAKQNGMFVQQSKYLQDHPKQVQKSVSRKKRLKRAKPGGFTTPAFSRPLLDGPDLSANGVFNAPMVKLPKFKKGWGRELHVPEWTCQWINDDNTKCGIECKGSYCLFHRKIVYRERV